MSDFTKSSSESVFTDYKKAYTPNQAVVEANRCLYCHDAPCITACPTSINIPQFIRRIANENTKGAAKTIFDANILGMSCARVCPVETLCVGDCVYNDMDVPPIQIGLLQRFATDEAYRKGWKYYTAGNDSGKSVGLIGGGPASLAAAHRLRIHGHRVVIYEKENYLGGLNTNGVAPYKMRADSSLSEVEWILSIGGIEIVSNVSVPNDISWHELEEKHDALFIGFGLGADRYLALNGSDSKGIMGAVEFIAKMKTESIDISSVTNAIVVGGGNTAIDAVRELLGLGVTNVTMVYRGVQAKMTGYAHEWKAALKENALASWKSQPAEFIHDNGTVTGLLCNRLNDEKTPTGEQFTLPANLILMAIGQGKLGDLVSELDGVNVEWGTIQTDENGATGRPGVYAGGDCRNGGKEVVNAAAEGKAAADAIDQYLKGAK